MEVENGGAAVPEQEVPSCSSAKGGASKRISAVTKKSNLSEGTTLKKRKKKIDSSSRSVQEYDPWIKYGSLFFLVAQMVGLVLLMRYTRTRTGNGELYIASTAVFFMEVVKVLVCNLVIFFEAGATISGLASEWYKHIWMSPEEMLKLCVPSLLYTVQNNLLYLALTNLDAATYQVCYQLKILTTAIFSAVLLNRKFSATKWTALVILTVGVAIVQISGSGDSHANSDPSIGQNHHDGPLPLEASSETAGWTSRFIGLVAVLCAACTSGFSGVYFEKILKGSDTSLWIRNLQMGLPSVIIALVTVFIHDGAKVKERGLLSGYTGLVWTVILIQALGGLIVALVVKYADNVLKVFASSFSIVVSCVVSALFFDFRPNFTFLVGTVLVVTSTAMYSKPEPRKRKRKPLLPVTVGSTSRKTRKSSLVM